MSAEAKPVEVAPQPEAPVETPKPVETAPIVEPSAEPATTTAPEAPVVAEAPKEDVTEAAPVKEEVKPVEEGVLGYKGPGLLKSFIFQKKFFYFGTEPVESKTLSSYLRGEKAQDTASKNVAWAAHTGKGLLFFTKKASEKATPAGIINLSDVSDITEEGTVDFHFTLGGQKHTFQANTLGDRDNWVAVLKGKVAEAKELAPTVVETEEYKKAHTDLTKPAVVAAASAPKKSVEKRRKEEKKARKSRSESRKRNSIFGSFGIGKKEEKTEEKKDATPATTEEAAAPAPAAEEPVVAAPEPAVAPEVTEPAPATEAAPVEAKPVAPKRNSIFGTLKSQFSQHKEKKPEADASPAVPAKETEPVSENAPVIPAVEESEPLATSVASPATVPAETTEVPATNGETKAAETPVVKSDKRKSSLPWLSKKEKATTSDEETEKPKSPFAKLRATVKGKASPKAEKPAASEEAEPATSEAPVVSEPAPVVPQSTPQVSASA
ncbi:Pleckstrin homology domain-containing protein [Leptodontidium sp. MPI-SDFR-AT-0119]|nr:Pleckstrin homology domain-containing protein [Leptodontidium sp. MPI-SDFR-AT-0119]